MLSAIAKDFPRDALQAFMIAAIVVVVSFPSFLLFNWASALTADDALRQEIARAFEDNTLARTIGLENDRQIGAAQYNDCVIMIMAENDYGAPLERALSPAGRLPKDEEALLARGVDPISLCDRLFDIVVQGNDAAYEHNPYHRYFHGTRALAEVVTPHTGIQNYREILLALNKIALIAAIVLAMRVYFTEDRNHGGLAIAMALFVLLHFAGFEYFSMSMSFGPADLMVYATILALLYVGLLRSAMRTYLTICALGGAFVIYFEFLTGQLPIAIALLIALPALATRSNEETNAAIRRAVFGTGVFAAVAIVLMSAKYLATYWVFGGAAVSDILGQLEMRASALDFSLLDLMMRLAYRSHHLVLGSTALGVAFSAAVIVAVGWAFWTDWSSRRHLGDAFPPWRFWRAVLILLSFASVGAWYLVFFSHAAIHAFFMVRPLGALYAIGLAYAVMVWFDGRDAAARPKQAGDAAAIEGETASTYASRAGNDGPNESNVDSMSVIKPR